MFTILIFFLSFSSVALYFARPDLNRYVRVGYHLKILRKPSAKMERNNRRRMWPEPMWSLSIVVFL